MDISDAEPPPNISPLIWVPYIARRRRNFVFMAYISTLSGVGLLQPAHVVIVGTVLYGYVYGCVYGCVCVYVGACGCRCICILCMCMYVDVCVYVCGRKCVCVGRCMCMSCRHAWRDWSMPRRRYQHHISSPQTCERVSLYTHHISRVLASVDMSPHTPVTAVAFQSIKHVHL